ncbi:MBL fold metallo-hydrolase [Microbacterium aquimaris]|uniref:MBL fold metallo-hydrolase n=1 Tax=Microbacterium aquimaris TaxID=459816 RepID=UPI002AD31854|nr:MBL fold metallo-hydrolase [Microbacterium aquimaris]MDZ8275041.1 MBL fold metallo-hydrolase [Microbacterium aquimaris]
MPDPVRIADGIWSVAIPMPGYLDYSLSVVAFGSEGSVGIVDPGWAGEKALEALGGFLRAQGADLGDVTTVVATHAHPDHLGLAHAVRERSGARLFLHAREQRSFDGAREVGDWWSVDRFREYGVPAEITERIARTMSGGDPVRPEAVVADVFVAEGDTIPLGDSSWRVVETPGHTPGHVALVEERHRLLATGDHVMPTIFPGVGLGVPSGPSALSDYFASLARLRAFGEHTVLPGHGYVFTGLAERLEEAEAHTRRRLDEVRAASAAEPTVDVFTLASRLTWTGGWEKVIASPMLASALLQTGIYRDHAIAAGL